MFLKNTIKGISLDCSLLECGYSFNAKFREFFLKQTKVENFKFIADMAEAWHRVKKELDRSFTIQNMLDIHYHKSDYAKYDNSSCKWNNFLKDFCKDERNGKLKNKLNISSVLWKVVRESSLPKIYYYNLVIKNNYLLKKYQWLNYFFSV